MATASDKAVLDAIFNPLMPPNEDTEENSVPVESEVISENGKKAKMLEVEGVKAAECNRMEEALKLFNEAIEVCPDCASCYNNRAQAFRLIGDIESAKQDLEKAIVLSGGKGKAACQAYTQRGLIARLDGRECDAKIDFEHAAQLGSAFAKTQLVIMNPYAAMCNKMLADVIGKLKRGEPEDSDECTIPA